LSLNLPTAEHKPQRGWHTDVVRHRARLKFN
jgi:hypothetical protein